VRPETLVCIHPTRLEVRSCPISGRARHQLVKDRSCLVGVLLWDRDNGRLIGWETTAQLGMT